MSVFQDHVTADGGELAMAVNLLCLKKGNPQQHSVSFSVLLKENDLLLIQIYSFDVIKVLVEEFADRKKIVRNFLKLIF